IGLDNLFFFFLLELSIDFFRVHVVTLSLRLNQSYAVRYCSVVIVGSFENNFALTVSGSRSNDHDSIVLMTENNWTIN
ncbi:hypothetical protein BpHYR1_028257, partial [Brachionus plicatilis]